MDRLSWLPSIDRASGALYLAIADAMAADIAAGRLRPGERLPPHRALAAALGIDFTTVTRAYAEARRRGLVDATVGRGTFVRGAAPRAARQGGAPRSSVDMTMNLPPQPAEAALRERLAQGLQAVQSREDLLSLLSYSQSIGRDEDREAGAAWLRPGLGEVSPDRVVVCAGAQTAMLALLTSFTRPGDLILTDAVTYPGFKTLATQLGRRLVGLQLDADGLLPDSLDEACRRLQPKALYCIPTIHNPTTATMPPERRAAIAEIARRHGLAIFEDDAYGALPREAPPPLAAMAPELTYHVAGLAKCIAPALRIAYLAAPTASQADRLAGAVRATTLMAPPLMAALATEWIAGGDAQAIVAAIRKEAAARQRIARQILPAGSFAAHPEGHHLWLTLPAAWSRTEFIDHVRQRGLAVVPSEAFAVDAAPPHAVRISLGAAADQSQLRQALQLVADALAASPTIMTAVI